MRSELFTLTIAAVLAMLSVSVNAMPATGAVGEYPYKQADAQGLAVRALEGGAGEEGAGEKEGGVGEEGTTNETADTSGESAPVEENAAVAEGASAEEGGSEEEGGADEA